MGDAQLKHDRQETSSIEGALIEQAQTGDEQAFGQIYDIWANKVYRFIFIKVKDTHTAEDITSEVFLKAWERLHQYKPHTDAKFSSWLYSVARNTVIDHYRASKTREISFDDLPEIADLDSEELYNEVGELEKALSQLPEEYEKVLRLRFVEGYPISKVAQMVKKKEDNIRAITSRALKKMREIIEG